MIEDEIESWMHATDEERDETHAQWNIKAGEGKKIADKVAGLFKHECIYGIEEVDIANNHNRWSIDAYVSPEDYENLKDRYNIEFLGFKINFHDINER